MVKHERRTSIIIEQFVMHAFDGRLSNCYLIKWINWLSWGLIIYFITFLFKFGDEMGSLFDQRKLN